MINKLSRVFIVALLLSTIIVYPTPAAISQTDYTEKISVTIIGDTAHWLIDMKGGNITIPGLAEIEDEISGVSSYKLLTIEPSKWVSEYEFFSTSGYNVLGFDVIPTSGIFLIVTSDDLQAAEKIADSLNEFLHLKFTIFSSDGEEYVFYSHMNFSHVKGKMWEAMPVWYGGSATLVDRDLFQYRDVPIFQFSAEKGSDGFIHSLTVGGFKRFAIKQQEFSLSSIFFGINNTRVSPETSSAIIRVNIIGGFVSFSGKGNVTNFPENKSATVITTLESEEYFPTLSLDVAQILPSVIVTREIEEASLNEGDIATIGIRVRNIAPLGSTPVSNISINEDWWNDMVEFEFEDGETNRTLGFLAPQGQFTLVYRLRVTSSDKEEILVPSNLISYSYSVQDEVVTDEVNINELALVLNDISPVINIFASIEASNPPILGNVPVNLTVQNNGNGHATNLEVGGKTRQSLLAQDVWNLSVDVPSNSLLDLSSFNIWQVNWESGNEQKNISSNSVTLRYNLTGENIPQFNVIRNIVHSVYEGGDSINETLTIINQGKHILDRVLVNGKIHQKFQFIRGNYSINENNLNAEFEDIEPGNQVAFNYAATITDIDENYVISPPGIIIESSGLRMSRIASSEVLPFGVKILKDFESSANFVGSNISIDTKVINTGSMPIFNVDLNAGADTFSDIIKGETTFSAEILRKDEQLGSPHDAMLISPGQFEAVQATASFTLAGQSFSKPSEEKTIHVYSPISAEMMIDLTNPIEGEEFSITLTVSNPSEVMVNDVMVKFTLPSEIRIISGSLDLDSVVLDAEAEIIKSAKLVVDKPTTLEIEPPIVEFSYVEDKLRGTSNSLIISVGDNIQSRYYIPILIAIFLILGTTYIARKVLLST
tara:strand:+ start:363 stop:3011 length:2649 start_codon:yes stop_codon:yes gene_type:complete